MNQLRKHKIKINDKLQLATIDTAGTAVIGYMIARKLNINPLILIGSLFLVSIPVHMYFKQATPLTTYVQNDIKTNGVV